MWLLYVLIYGVLGLVIGSFLNVVIHRFPQGQSISTPRSHCPECGHFLRAWELIPVVSYILLRGRCSECRTSISWRYPVVESTTATLFILSRVLQPEKSDMVIIFDLIFISILLVLTMIDIDTFRLPDLLVVLVAVTGILKTLIIAEPGFLNSLIGAAGAGGIFFLIAHFYPDGMGLGDVKLVAALGIYLGFPDVFYAIFLASFFGVIVGGINYVLKRKNLKEPIPFGPFLASGAVVILWGKEYVGALSVYLF